MLSLGVSGKGSPTETTPVVCVHIRMLREGEAWDREGTGLHNWWADKFEIHMID